MSRPGGQGRPWPRRQSRARKRSATTRPPVRAVRGQDGRGSGPGRARPSGGGGRRDGREGPRLALPLPPWACPLTPGQTSRRQRGHVSGAPGQASAGGVWRPHAAGTTTTVISSRVPRAGRRTQWAPTQNARLGIPSRAPAQTARGLMFYGCVLQRPLETAVDAGPLRGPAVLPRGAAVKILISRLPAFTGRAPSAGVRAPGRWSTRRAENPVHPWHRRSSGVSMGCCALSR